MRHGDTLSSVSSYLSGCGVLGTFIYAWVSHNFLTDKRNQLHTFFFTNHQSSRAGLEENIANGEPFIFKRPY